jgi:hypothetical protein
MKKYLILTLVISILVGIILPLFLGVKDLTLIAISSCSVWFVYAVLMFITTFLIEPGLKIRVDEGIIEPPIPPEKLQSLNAKYNSHKKD